MRCWSSREIGAPPEPTLRRLERSYFPKSGWFSTRRIIVPIGPQFVTFSRSISCITCTGSKRPVVQTVLTPVESSVTAPA